MRANFFQKIAIMVKSIYVTLKITFIVLVWQLRHSYDRKEGDELLVPIVPGIFTKAVIKNKDEILIGVGKGVVVKSDIDHAIEILQQQIKELTRHRDEMLVELNGLILRAQELEKKLQKLQK